MFDLFVVFWKAVFKVTEKPSDEVASGRKDGQTDHDEEDPLQYRQKKAQNPKENEEPAEHQGENFFDLIHFAILFLETFRKGDLMI